MTGRADPAYTPRRPAQDQSDGSEGDAPEVGRGVQMVECVDCGHDFHPDSSPHEDRCWQCAELADAEADR